MLIERLLGRQCEELRPDKKGGQQRGTDPVLHVISSIAGNMLGNLDDLRVALEVAEDLLAERVGDLRVDPGVLDVLVAQLIGHVLDAAAGVEEMHRDRVPQGVNRAALDAGGPAYFSKRLWTWRFFSGPSRPVKR